MAIEKLKPRFVETVKTKGLYGDGGGLYLQVGEGGESKSWIFRYHVPGKGDRQMGLGSYETVRMSDARERARQCRLQRDAGIDPIEARLKQRLDQKLAAAKEKTFRQVFEEWFEEEAKSWIPGTAAMYRRKVEMHALPQLGKLPIQKFDMRDETSSAAILLADVLKPLVSAGKFVTARDLRWLIEGILSHANASNYIRGDNAANLKGPLGKLVNLKKIAKAYVPDNHPALPYEQIGKFMAALRAYGDPAIAPIADRCSCELCNGPHAQEIAALRFQGASAANLARKFGLPVGTMGRHLQRVGKPFIRPLASYALEFAILTAVRREQATSARWDEIDWANRQWDCSEHKTRNKTRKAYTVLLSEPAMAVLKKMKKWQAASAIDSQFVFDVGVRGRHYGFPLRADAVTHFLDRGINSAGNWKASDGRKISTHGFRTSFSSWGYDTGEEEAAIEIALGHSLGNGVAKIYNRQAEKIQVRKHLMDAWGGYCDRTEPLPSAVIPFRQSKQELAS